MLAALETEAFSDLLREQAPAATREQLIRAHRPDYVDAILSIRPEAGELVQLDGDTAMNAGSAEAALRAAGAAVLGVDAVMDCSGNPDARVAAVRSACTWGRVAFVGEGNTTTFDISRDFIRRQLTIHASWTFSADSSIRTPRTSPAA